MKEISIGRQTVPIKDYYCSSDGVYIPRDDGKLWLYVMITDVCPFSCPFCVSPGRKSGRSYFDPVKFREQLKLIKDNVYGISFTGGEPMMEVDLLDEVIAVAFDVMKGSVELDMVTSGFHLENILEMESARHLDSIHISRHRIDDESNRRVMGGKTPGLEELSYVIRRASDPARFVFNCVLQKSGVHDLESIASYLEMAAEIGMRNSSFIAMIPANAYCLEQYVDPGSIDFSQDSRFRVWNRFHDHDFCSCSSGDYHARNGYVRYYYRMPGSQAAPYVRQLVYDAENRIRLGFGGDVLNNKCFSGVRQTQSV